MTDNTLRLLWVPQQKTNNRTAKRFFGTQDVQHRMWKEGSKCIGWIQEERHQCSWTEGFEMKPHKCDEHIRWWLNLQTKGLDSWVLFHFVNHWKRTPKSLKFACTVSSFLPPFWFMVICCCFPDDQIGVDGAVALSEMLKTNSTLTTIALDSLKHNVCLRGYLHW